MLIKTCKCCGTRAQTRRQRVCRVCKVPALWDQRQETAAEIKARETGNAEAEQTLRDILEEHRLNPRTA